MKRCTCCNKVFPLSEFGINHQYPDGRAIYSKACNRRKSEIVRRRRGAIAYLKLPKVPKRKPSITSLSREKVLQVRNAVQAGNRTRAAIKRQAKLSWDETVDALAQLTFVEQKLLVRRIGGEAHFFVKAA